VRAVCEEVDIIGRDHLFLMDRPFIHSESIIVAINTYEYIGNPDINTRKALQAPATYKWADAYNR
jgi:hypothetical protein